MFVFRKEVDEVTLHATVVDDKNRLITSLDRSAFSVFENSQPQQIRSFRREDIPVAMGIVIDNSGSMREKRDQVNKAALNLVRSSNPQDQVFVVNFSDEYYLDQEFTSDIKKLQASGVKRPYGMDWGNLDWIGYYNFLYQNGSTFYTPDCKPKPRPWPLPHPASHRAMHSRRPCNSDSVCGASTHAPTVLRQEK